MIVLRRLALLVLAMLTTGTLCLSFAIHHVLVENEKTAEPGQLSANPADQALESTLPLAIVLPLLPDEGRRATWLTVFTAHDQAGHSFVLNGASRGRVEQFHAPYVRLTDADIAAFNAKPDAVLLSEQVAADAGWRVGERIELSTDFGKVPAQVVAIVPTMVEKAIVHHEWLDPLVPEHERGQVTYLTFPSPDERTGAITAAFERAGHPARVDTQHRIIVNEFVAAQGPKIVNAFSLLSLFVFVSIVGLFYASRLHGVAPLVVLGSIFGAAGTCAWTHHRPFAAAWWVLEEIKVDGQSAAAAVAVTIGAALLGITVVAGARRLVSGGTGPLLATTSSLLLVSLSTFLVGAGVTIYESAHRVLLARADAHVLLAGHYEPYSELTPLQITEAESALAGVRHSVETMIDLNYDDRAARAWPIVVRGVDQAGRAAHRELELAAGTFPAVAAPGLVVGAALVEYFPDLSLGRTARVGKHRWPVIGVLRRSGTLADSQVWCDLAALQKELNRSNASSIWIDPGERVPSAWAGIHEPLTVVSGIDFDDRSRAALELWRLPVATSVVLLWLVAAFAIGAEAERRSLNGAADRRRRALQIVGAAIVGALGVCALNGMSLGFGAPYTGFFVRLSGVAALACAAHATATIGASFWFSRRATHRS